MEWLILAVVSWILLLLLVDWTTLKRNFWCGLVAVLLQILVDNTGVSHGMYGIFKGWFIIFHSNPLFTLGPVFSVGVLLSQYYPKSRVMRILNILVLTMLYTLQEILLVTRGNVVYTNWHLADSVGVNLMAMIILSWFVMEILNKGAEGER